MSILDTARRLVAQIETEHPEGSGMLVVSYHAVGTSIPVQLAHRMVGEKYGPHTGLRIGGPDGFTIYPPNAGEEGLATLAAMARTILDQVQAEQAKYPPSVEASQ